MKKGNYLGEFELVVLLALARLHGPASGMLIYDEICDTTGRDVSVHSVYVTLSRMEKKGYVVTRSGEAARNGSTAGRAKKCFELSAVGLTALRKTRDMYDRLWSGISLNPGASQS